MAALAKIDPPPNAFVEGGVEKILVVGVAAAEVANMDCSGLGIVETVAPPPKMLPVDGVVATALTAAPPPKMLAEVGVTKLENGDADAVDPNALGVAAAPAPPPKTELNGEDAGTGKNLI